MLTERQCSAVRAAIARLPARERPGQVCDLFDLLLAHTSADTGELLLPRADVARRMGTHPVNVSRAMATLAGLHVVARARRPGSYALNPFVAWPHRGPSAPYTPPPPPPPPTDGA